MPTTPHEIRRVLRSDIGPFAVVPLWLFEAGASARAIHVYAFLGARYANRDHRAWPTRERLASDLGVSIKVVERAIDELRDLKALQTERRHRAKDGAVVGLEYLLVQAKPVDADHSVKNDVQAVASQSAAGDVQETGENRPKTAQQSTPVSSDPAAGIHSVKNDVQASASQSDAGDVQADTCTSGAKIEPKRQICPTHSVKNDAQYKEEPDPTEPDPTTDLAQSARRTDDATAETEHADKRPVFLLEAYAAAFSERFPGRAPHITAGKDARLLKDLAAAHGDPFVRELLTWFFQSPDPFIRSTGYTVGVFASCFNKLQLTYRPQAASTDGEAIVAIRRRAQQRRELLEQTAQVALAHLPNDRRHALERIVLDRLTDDHRDLFTRLTEAQRLRAATAAVVHLVVSRAIEERSSVEAVLRSYDQVFAA